MEQNESPTTPNSGAHAVGRRVRTGLSALVLTLLAGLLIGVLGLGLTLWKAPSLFGLETTTKDEKVVTSLTREQQVVLLSLGIQGIMSEQSQLTVAGVKVPGTQKIVYLQYGYKAKLGIDGRQVRIEKIGEKRYKVTIPEFIFIGHTDEEFRVAVEKNGALSLVTPDVDRTKLINQILDDKAKTEQININQDLLEQQAQVFYSDIVRAIDPDITLEFAFTRN